MSPTGREATDRTRAPLADLREEVARVLEATGAAGLTLRATGGLAVWIRCPSARRAPLARDYKDLDLVGLAGEARLATDVLAGLGYEPDHEFNSINGHQRLLFWDPSNGRQLDVFVDRMRMSHELDLAGRVDLDEMTISLADLLLTKLQVVEVNEKDLKDATAILLDHEVSPGAIDGERIVAVTTSDWGWWRTTADTLDKVVAYAGSLSTLAGADEVTTRAGELRALIDEAPKSLRWKVRARVGDRLRWYELPEEIDG
jgi:hypothetical protein